MYDIWWVPSHKELRRFAKENQKWELSLVKLSLLENFHTAVESQQLRFFEFWESFVKKGLYITHPQWSVGERENHPTRDYIILGVIVSTIFPLLLMLLLMKSGRFTSFSVFYCHFPSYLCFFVNKVLAACRFIIILGVLLSFFPCTLYFNFFFVWVLYLIKFGRFASF
jgi:hypothetical protein